MSLKDQNIEELFRSGLEDAELPVNDAMWNNISKGLSQTTAATTATTSATKILTYIGLSGAACAIGVAATLYFSETSEKQITEVPNDVVTISEVSNNNVVEQIDVIKTNDSEDEEIVDQIIHKEDIQKDPIISEDEKIKETKKVVTVSETEKNTYKGSWVNDFLTPKKAPITEPSSQEDNTASATEDITTDVTKSEEPVKPSITEEIEDEIIASIVAMPVGGYAPLEVSFAHHSEQGEASWDFGDGIGSKENAVTHTFEKVGKYTVTLTVTNKDGKEFQDYRVIEVLANSALTKIPNVFTPNNDGTNDFFKVEGKNIASFSLAIINTKGEFIYQSDDINAEWNGKDKFGDDLSTGTYVVIISAKGIDGKKYEHSGTVTLKR
jgi:gliding motility-associated-like protein